MIETRSSLADTMYVINLAEVSITNGPSFFGVFGSASSYYSLI